MLLTLFDITGNRKLDFSPADSSTQVKEIQADNILSLSFTSHEYVMFGVNDYVDFCGERYWAMSEYVPNEIARKTWKYDVRLFGKESLIKRYLILNDTDGESNPEFTLTAPAIVHLALIIRCMNSGIGTDEWSIGNVVETGNLVIDYSGTYCDEGLKFLAEAAGTEYWFDGTKVNLCRCESGETITLGYGNGITSITPSTANNVKFYTRLFPLGSTRNIDPSRYGHKRLQLPGGAKFVDINTERYGIIHHCEESAFVGIYPRRIGTISEVRSKEVEDNDGVPYTIYCFKDDGLDFNPNDYQLPNEIIRVSFQEGSELAGLGTGDDHYFEVNWNDEECEFEIITQWPEGSDVQLPGGLLVPKVGDTYILWNLSMPDEYYPLAEQEFKEAVDAYNAEHDIDLTIFKCPTDHVWVEENNVALTIGQRIRLENNFYFPETGYRNSRIVKMTRRVNLPTYIDLEIGDALSRSSMAKIEDSVRDVRTFVQELVRHEIVDVIKTGDTDSPTDYNVFSALKSLSLFLRKDKADTAKGIIKFLAGLEVGNYLPETSGIKLFKDGKAELGSLKVNGQSDFMGLAKFLEGLTVGLYQEGSTGGSKLFKNGKAELGSLQVNGNAEFRRNLSSKDFISGFTAGKGWAIMLKEYLNAAGVTETKSYAEFDNLTIRGTLRVFEFIISQMLGENDNRTFTAMMEVDHYDPETGRVYLDTQDGKLYNPFRVDDIIVVQQYQPGNTGAEGGSGYVVKSYELVITEVGVGDLSDKEERLDWVRFKNFVTTMEGVYPKDLISQHDTFVRIDNLSDPTRKGIIQMMTVGENTPYMDVIYGAKTDPNNKLKTRVGNMEGIYNHLLGWLHEWGLYAINAYLVGEMKIAHTGMDVSNRIEMTANSFSTNYRQLEFNVPEQDNFFSDPTFTEGLWTFGNTDTAMFVTGGGELLYLNRNIYAQDDSFVGLVEHNGRQMLRICNSYIKLDSNYIRSAGTHKRYMNTTELAKKYGRTVEGETDKVYDMEQMAANYLQPKYVEEWDNMYLAMRFICRQSGVVRYGFKSMTPDGYTWYETTHHPTTIGVDTEAREVEFPLVSPVYVQTTQDIDFVIEEDSGAWDGVGDFYVYVDGEIYLDFLTLTNQPLEAFKSENSTKIEQDAFHISLMAERTVGNTTNIGRLTVRADLIEGFVGEYLDGDLTLATLIQQTKDAITLSANNYTDGKFAALSVRADGIEARVANNEGDISTLQLTAQGLTGRITSAEGDIADLELTAQGLSTRLTNAEGDINNLKVTARGIEQRVTTAEGNIGTLIVDAEQLFNELEDAEGNISTLQQTATSFGVRITNAEGDISTLEQTATSLSSRITSEVNGLQSQINQTADMIEMQLGYEDSNGNWVWASSITQEIEDTVDGKVSTITIDADQVKIDANSNFTVNDVLTVDNGAVHINGTLDACDGEFNGEVGIGFNYEHNRYNYIEINEGYGDYGIEQYPHIIVQDWNYNSRYDMYESGSTAYVTSDAIALYDGLSQAILKSDSLEIGYNQYGSGYIKIDESGIYHMDSNGTVHTWP